MINVGVSSYLVNDRHSSCNAFIVIVVPKNACVYERTRIIIIMSVRSIVRMCMCVCVCARARVCMREHVCEYVCDCPSVGVTSFKHKTISICSRYIYTNVKLQE